MALVAFLRGINVGGHRRFRPSTLVKRLAHLDLVNIGAAGTFVIRRSMGIAKLRAELEGCLPFDAEIAICEGREIVRLVSRNPFADLPAERSDVVPFVSVLPRRPRSVPTMPVCFPLDDEWLVQVRALDGRFVIGVHRRHMKVIGYLGKLDQLFGVSATTRNWKTILTIARVLDGGSRDVGLMLRQPDSGHRT